MEGLHRSSVRIGITVGDPAGCGPILLKESLREFKNKDIILYGPKELLEFANGYEMVTVDYYDFSKGEPSAQSGKIAYNSLVKSIDDALKGRIDAIVTAPVSKESIFLAGYHYAGQTEILKEKTGENPIMVMGHRDIIEVAFYTRHIPLKDVVKYVKKEKLIKFFLRLFVFYDKVRVMGLNPHAGENGKIGKEEIEEIFPAIEELKNEGYDIDGPYSADTVLWRDKENCVWVAMYHDQGAIVSKSACGYKTLNISIGMPFLRVSPGHGTAFDKIKSGERIDPTSMIEAINFAFNWAKDYKDRYKRGYYGKESRRTDEDG